MVLSSVAISFVVPTVNAYAATNTNLVARYFVNDTNSNEVGSANLINNGDAIEWSTQENAAHFNSNNNKQNYLKVKFSDVLPSVNYVDGMTVNFMAKDSSRTGSWRRYFEITCAKPYSGEQKSYLYGASSYDDSAYDGYLKDFRIYEGTDPSMPVMFLERLWKGGAFGGQQNMWTFYAGIKDNQGFYFNDNWHGTDGQLNFLYCHNNNPATGLNYNIGEVDSFHKISRNNSKGEYKYYYSNKMLFNGATFADNEYYRVVKNITWNMLFSNNDDPYYDNGDSHYKDFVGTEGDKLGINTNEVENPVYIINYKPVIDEMSNYKAASLNVTNYKEGGLSNLLEKVDALAEFDMLKEYTFDGNSFDNIERCANRMNTLVSDVRAQRVILLDNSDKVVSVAYASVGSVISFRDTIFSVDGVNVMSKQIPFYTAKGFVVDGDTYTSGSTYTVDDTDDIIVHTIYNA